jgi:pilus assembly protein Flp/PilA
MTRFFSQLLRDESGATAIEYGLIAALISVVIITAVTLVGSNLSTVFNGIATALGNA